MKKRNKIIVFILLGLFIINCILVLTKVYDKLDNTIMSFMLSIRSDNLTKIMTSITNVGSAYALIVICILLLCFMKDRKMAVKIIINLIFVFITSQVLKIIFHRPRPDELYLVKVYDYSYPSGHAMVSLVFYGYLLYLINKSKLNKLFKVLFMIIIPILLLAIFFSRLYLGVHYLSDIISGILFGFICLILYVEYSDKKKAKE